MFRAAHSWGVWLRAARTAKGMRVDNKYAIAKWFAVICMAVAATWARVPQVIQILVYVMGIDIATGFLLSLKQRNFQASMMFNGLVQKGCVLLLLGLLHLIEVPLKIPFELEQTVAVGFLLYEAMSIIENCAMVGVPIPIIVVQTLAKARIKTASLEEIKRSFKTEVEDTEAVRRTPFGSPDLKITEHKETATIQTVTELPESSEPGLKK